MNKLYVAILIVFSFLISGCVQKNVNENNSKVLEFGNKNNYVNKVTYINKDKSIIFYIDKKQSSTKFNLCDKKASNCDNYFEFFKTDDKTYPLKVSYNIISQDGITQKVTITNLVYGIIDVEKDTYIKVE